MLTLLYLHGFLSSAQSAKAQQTCAWLASHRPDWRVVCPDLPARPAAAWSELQTLAGTELVEPLGIIGSSLGGFWATALLQQFPAARAVLVNPAVRPHERFADLVGVPLNHYHTGEPVTLQPEDGQLLSSLSPDRFDAPTRTWLLVQQGDETLDYRQAVDFYQGARQTVEAGGNHSFAGYGDWLPQIMDWLSQPAPPRT